MSADNNTMQETDWLALISEKEPQTNSLPCLYLLFLANNTLEWTMDRTQQYNISEANLAARREVVGLDRAAIKALGRAAPWAESHARKVSKDFYDHQFSCAGPSIFFENFAAERGMAVSSLREHLESAHAEYFAQIFREATKPEPFGLAYFETRLHVGKLHNTINLPLKLFLGAFVKFSIIAEKNFRRSHPLRPFYQRRVRHALTAAFNYDAQAICDAFFVELLESLSIDTQQVRTPGSDRDVAEELGKLKENMSALVDNLRQASDQLATGSDALHMGSTHLAEQSQKQAASLQDTAAAVVQITESAESTSKFATTANELTTEGRQSAGGMKQPSVIETMDSLDASSKEISNISGLIEDIAFQTNLLALNASVEAARAGEHGRGFSIVASEVGNLAKRCSDAAKEIKSLIELSTKNVETGVHSVAEVAEMVQQISSGSAEQSRAIQDISNAITAADTATQLNAQQADQLKTLAETMRENSALVSQAVSVFKVA